MYVYIHVYIQYMYVHTYIYHIMYCHWTHHSLRNDALNTFSYSKPLFHLLSSVTTTSLGCNAIVTDYRRSNRSKSEVQETTEV